MIQSRSQNLRRQRGATAPPASPLLSHKNAATATTAAPEAELRHAQALRPRGVVCLLELARGRVCLATSDPLRIGGDDVAALALESGIWGRRARHCHLGGRRWAAPPAPDLSSTGAACATPRKRRRALARARRIREAWSEVHRTNARRGHLSDGSWAAPPAPNFSSADAACAAPRECW